MDTPTCFLVLFYAMFQSSAARNSSKFTTSDQISRSGVVRNENRLSQDEISIVSDGLGRNRARNVLDMIKQNGGDISQGVTHSPKETTFNHILQGNSNSEKWISKIVILLRQALSMTFRNITTTSACANDTKRLMNSILSRKKWTFSFVDAAAKPGPSITLGWLNLVGNYEQCQDAEAPPSSITEDTGFRGQYCVFLLSSPISSLKPKVSLCVPDTCSNVEVKMIATEIIRQFESNITLKSVEFYRGRTKVTSATVIAIIILTVIGTLVILGTAYDLVYINKWFKSSTLVSSDGNSSENASIDSKSFSKNYETISNTSDILKSEFETTARYIEKIMLSFSAYTNGKKVLTVSNNSDSLQAVHGIRYLSICWVVLAHTYSFGYPHTVNFTTEFPRLLDRWTFSVIANGFVSVDTFFTLSGLLTSYLTITKMKKNGLNINWPAFYFHRFWRLTPPYMIVLVLYLGLMQYLGEGALWADEQPWDKKSCENNWWRNLLYINNFQNIDDLCMIHSWYLANDMQFFTLSPLMLIPLYFHRVAGIVCCLVFLSASWTVTFVLSTVNEWVTVIISKIITTEKTMDWADDYYIKPWCRIGPFIVGVLAGYLLTHIKGNSLKIKWWVVALGWTLSTGSALSVIYGLHGDISGDHRSSTEVAALYNSVARSVWGAAICWIVIACDAGYGGPVNTFLSWSPFVVLGRLTYMIYLIHPYIMSIVYQNMGSLFFLTDTTMAIYFIGFLVFSTCTAFFCMLCFESPMIGLERTFLRQRKQE